MKTLNLLSILILIFAVQTVSVFAQKADKNKTAKKVKQTDKLVKPVEAYAKTISDFVEKEGKPHLVIADVADYNEAEEPVWKKFASEDEFEKSRETEEAYTIAYIWKKDGKPVQVNTTYSSPSGDWVEYFYQTYRADGSLAKSVRDYRTFMGNIAVKRTRIYDEKGKLLKESTEYRDLNTDKIIKPTDNYQDVEAGQEYLKISDFPFAEMFKDK